jgi:hypothetical protein
MQNFSFVSDNPEFEQGYSDDNLSFERKGNEEDDYLSDPVYYRPSSESESEHDDYDEINKCKW